MNVFLCKNGYSFAYSLHFCSKCSSFRDIRSWSGVKLIEIRALLKQIAKLTCLVSPHLKANNEHPPGQIINKEHSLSNWSAFPVKIFPVFDVFLSLLDCFLQLLEHRLRKCLQTHEKVSKILMFSMVFNW